VVIPVRLRKEKLKMAGKTQKIRGFSSWKQVGNEVGKFFPTA
jgi:hypothetical protein